LANAASTGSQPSQPSILVILYSINSGVGGVQRGKLYKHHGQQLRLGYVLYDRQPSQGTPPACRRTQVYKVSCAVSQLTDNREKQKMSITLGATKVTTISDGGISLYFDGRTERHVPVFCIEVFLLCNPDASQNERNSIKFITRPTIKCMRPRYTLKCWVWFCGKVSRITSTV
jgi:hypothetical protein